jgi:hypothetical protein
MALTHHVRLSQCRYNLLDWVFPTKTLATFLSKVASNQLLLAPCTLTAVFAWNLPLANQAMDLPKKLQNDMFPTLQNGKHLMGGEPVQQAFNSLIILINNIPLKTTTAGATCTP